MTRPAVPTGPQLLDVPVTGGVVLVARWWRGEPAVAAHGVTANHRRWALLAVHRGWALLAGALAALDGRGTLVAPDSRGRGASASIIGPFGIDAHADDLVAALDRIGASTQPSSGTPWAGSSPSPASPATPSESGGSSSSTAVSCSASGPGGNHGR